MPVQRTIWYANFANFASKNGHDDCSWLELKLKVIGQGQGWDYGWRDVWHHDERGWEEISSCGRANALKLKFHGSRLLVASSWHPREAVAVPGLLARICYEETAPVEFQL